MNMQIFLMKSATSLFFVLQCFPGCLTIQIRTALSIFIVLLIYAVAQACVVSGKVKSKKHSPWPSLLMINIK